MKPDEVLICSTCHTEARIVRLGKSLLVLGHAVNPRQHHHEVTIPRSRAAHEATPRSRGRNTREQRGAREDAPLPNDDRHASRVKRAVPDRISSGTLQPSGERQSQRDPSPVPAVPMSAGRSTAGGG